MQKSKKKVRMGRKPLPEKQKKVQVQFYTPLANVEAVGGMEEAKRIAQESIESLPIS